MKLQRKAVRACFQAFVTEAAVLLIGSVMFGLSVNLFIEPGEITMSGFTGVSTTINYFLGTPIGIMMILLNLPLLFRSEERRVGKECL